MFHLFILLLFTISQATSRQRLFASEPDEISNNINEEVELFSTNEIFFLDETKEKNNMTEEGLIETSEDDNNEDNNGTITIEKFPIVPTDETSENSIVIVNNKPRTSVFPVSYGGSHFPSGSNSLFPQLGSPFPMGGNRPVRHRSFGPIPSGGTYQGLQSGAYQPGGSYGGQMSFMPNHFNLNPALQPSGHYPGRPFSGSMPPRPQSVNYNLGYHLGGYYPGGPQSVNFNQGNSWPSFPSQGQNSQCLKWCQAGNGYGSYHCCQGKEVNLGNLASFAPQCPASRTSCTNGIRTNAPMLCNNDQQCLNQVLPSKCCQDVCLNKFVCKPAMMPRGPQLGQMTQTNAGELVPK